MRVRLAVALALLAITACILCPAQEVSVAGPPRPTSKGPTGAVTGTVYCADTNAPARLAQVYLIPASGDKTNAFSPSMGAVDLDGHFAIGNVPEGKYLVSVMLIGYLNPAGNLTIDKLAEMTPEARKAAEARRIAVTVSAKQPADMAIRLERAAEIDGTVLFDDGSPAIGLQVRLEPKPEKGETPTNPAETFEALAEDIRLLNSSDDHGHYRILGVAPGEYVVSVRVPAISGERADPLSMFAMLPFAGIGALNVYYGDAFRASKAKVLKIEAGAATADITIPLGKLHTIRGHIVLKSTGDPPPAGAVMLQYADTRENARVGLVNESGEFSFFYVPEGSYILTAGASPEPLPQLPEGDEGGVWSFSPSELGVDDKRPDGMASIPVLVIGDVTGVTLSVPDPPPAPPKQPENPSDAENPSAPAAPPPQ